MESKDVIILAVVVILVGTAPLLIIWALNLLFGLTIPITLKTWFATFVLAGVFRPTPQGGK